MNKKLSCLYLLSLISASHVSMAETIDGICSERCQGNPPAYGVEFTGSYNRGRNECITNPASCGITGYTQTQLDDAVRNATQTGRNECKLNPASCEISVTSGYTQDQLNTAVTTATQTGRNECISNPASCNLLTYTQEQLVIFTQTTKEAVKRECQDNPTSCAIDVTSKGIIQCQTNPSSCSLFNQAQLDGVKLQLDISDGQFILADGKATLYIPSVNPVQQVTPEMASSFKLVLKNKTGEGPYLFELVFPTPQTQSGTGTQNATSSTAQPPVN